VTATLAPIRLPLAETGPGRRGRKVRSSVATAMIVVSFVIIVIPLIFVIGYVIQRGASYVDIPFLTKSIPIQDSDTGPGMGPAVIGTLLITGAATAMAVPLGVLGGIYLAEYSGRGPFGRLVRFLAEVMTGVPSIVMGLFIYIIWVLNFGVSGFAGALALGALMLPVVIRTTEEMIRLVPRDQREASYALGGRQASTIGRIVVPAAIPGAPGGCPRRRRNRAVDLHHSHGESDEHEPVLGPEHGTVNPDLPQRPDRVPRRADARLGRRVHPDPDRVRVHNPGPTRDIHLRTPPSGVTG
jgi:phosphate transport system permease protein